MKCLTPAWIFSSFKNDSDALTCFSDSNNWEILILNDSTISAITTEFSFISFCLLFTVSILSWRSFSKSPWGHAVSHNGHSPVWGINEILSFVKLSLLEFQFASESDFISSIAVFISLSAAVNLSLFNWISEYFSLFRRSLKFSWFILRGFDCILLIPSYIESILNLSNSLPPSFLRCSLMNSRTSESVYFRSL